MLPSEASDDWLLVGHQEEEAPRRLFIHIRRTDWRSAALTLIHDGIMDKAPLRRGEQTVHTKWNENTAILSGDAMLIEAYKLLADYTPQTCHLLIRLFNTTATEVCEGQQYDMDFEWQSHVSIPEYLEMIRLNNGCIAGMQSANGSN